MGFKRFEIGLVLQISLLTITIFLFSWVWFKTSLNYTAIILFLTIPAQIYGFYLFINKTNRKLTSFFDAIRHSEFNYNFSVQDQSKTYSELNKVLDDIITQYRTIKQTKEEQFFFYQTIIQHIGISLIAYKQNGEIVLANTSAHRLFRLNKFVHINQLAAIDQKLASLLATISEGQKKLVKIQIDDEYYQLSIHAKTMKQESGIINLVTIQNIQTELEEKEIESWQKLIRVLTHEIMNSITPVTSLTDTLSTMLKTDEGFNSENIDDVRLAINTIHKRSAGLLQFVETYRNLTKIATPQFERMSIESFLKEIKKLFDKDIQTLGIDFNIEIANSELEIVADESMMERVLINLVRNAIQAANDDCKPRITIRSYQNATGNIFIQVIDNGMGILPEVIERIFIPFFSTRPNGSGIGLALSRQLIRAQGGTIGATSKDGETVFTIRF